MRVYIAGRITGLPYDLVKAKFQRAEALVMSNNWTPVNPTKHVTAKASEAEAMKILIPILCDCNAILLLNDWQFSGGARLEEAAARYMHKQIINEDDLT